jgi:hypothetical protein
LKNRSFFLMMDNAFFFRLNASAIKKCQRTNCGSD